MSQTPNDLAAQISKLASQLAVHPDLAETENPRKALYDVASALSSLTTPLQIWVTHAGEYPENTTGGELTAPSTALKEAIRAAHHLLAKL